MIDKKSDTAFRTISEVAEELKVPQHVLRFWETKFSQVTPLKRGGGRRYYRPEDVALLKKIHTLLYAEGYTIKGVQKLLRGISKLQVLEEQKTRESSSNVFGKSMPKVEVPAQKVVEPAISQKDYLDILDSVLGELKDLRTQVQSLLSHEESEQVA